MPKDECQPRMTATCETELQQPVVSGSCSAWTACLPFGGQLSFAGGCVNYTPGDPPPDGVYSKIVIANGCIIDAQLADIPIYTPAPCAPIPVSCDCDGAGTLPDPSPAAGNLFRYDPSGRPLVKLSVSNGDGITVAGTGTADDPLVITNTQTAQAKDYFRSGNAALSLTGTGTSVDPYTYTHVTNLSGKQGAYTFDDYGHLVSYDPPTVSTYVTGILEGDGIKVDTDLATGIVRVGLADPTLVITGKYLLGGYELEFYRNRLVNMSRIISETAGTYTMRAETGGTYAVEVNDLGSIVNIVYSPAPSPDPTKVSTAASKRFVTAGENTREMTITTERNSSFRVSYIDPAVPADILLFVDGVAIDGMRIPATGAHHFEAVPTALYAQGTHSLLLQSDAGFTGVGILDLVLTTVR